MRRNLKFLPFLLRHSQTYFDSATQPIKLSLHFPSSNFSVLYPPPRNHYIPRPAAAYASFTSSSTAGDEEDAFGGDQNHDSDSESDEDIAAHRTVCNSGSAGDLKILMGILQTLDPQEKSKRLDHSGVNLTRQLAADVLAGTRNNWEAAFTFFVWAGKQPGYSHSLREYHTMIAILGKFRKFDTAWSVIDGMRPLSLVTPHTLLIIIRKYAAVHDVGRAINAFYAHKRFGFKVGVDEFQGLLSALCRYKNVKDAEHLLFCNASIFPLCTKSFNIVLNGWCNVLGSLKEGKRIWKEMERRGVRHDVHSYSSIISCLSKLNRMGVVLKLYEKMKALDIQPDRKVYNAVIHALAKGRLVNEARGLMKTMEDKGISPNSITYNSIVMPLCKYRKLEEARELFNEMTARGLLPTTRTYHAFIRALRTGDEVFDLLDKMREAGCIPDHDTYIMLIKKFCRRRQLDLVFRVWAEMGKNGLDPDRSSYIVLIHGLFLNGKLDEANKYYLEMKEKELLPEPEIDAMLRAWVEGKTGDKLQKDAPIDDRRSFSKLGDKAGIKSKKNHRENHFLRQPESRSVTREKGYSFWGH
ncbi:Pentatricopeptide repeat-containing protein -mitochondrial [Striga hermonthica]|uniref:Pentatricopeptide repeat-containing protein -mitochondrial n=1 Tax=Striga hermonthica TaxID=68872 RepID=A0A9N7NWB6_STRHE|nr:Pentatricopeptide repeat-containing protein -mitochondrial [Striga hermonthica]